MPSFTITDDTIQSEGLLVTIRIAAPPIIPVNPLPISVLAMVDTGASLSAICNDIPPRLGLQPFNQVLVSTPTTPELCPQYLTQMIFPNNVVIPNIPVVGMSLQSLSVKCLIGRDVLSKGVLIYNGYMNSFTLSF